METIISLVLLIAMGLLCSYIYKKKGRSPVAGFLWGFLFFILGLLIVVLEKDKNTQTETEKKQLSLTQWIGIFVGVGILLIIVFFIGINLG